MWSELGARARGLSTRLLGAATLRELSGARDLPAMTMALAATGAGFPETLPATPLAIERAEVARAAAQLRALARWSGPQGKLLAPVLDAEDRRSVAAIVHGAVHGAAADDRLAGLLPTPTLPARALAELARQPNVTAIGALLTAWRHPLAPALAPEAGRATPDLLALELRLAQRWAARARAAARAGDRALRAFVATGIDIENCWTALAASRGDPSWAHDAFLRGGARLDEPAFRRAAGVGDSSAAALLADRFDATPLARALREPHAAPALERAALATMLAEQRALARREPLGAAPAILYVLRLRAELADLRRIAAGIALYVPRERIVAELVAP
jgi:vacuolar-type H+-ATPase subunit C/Vma6